MAFVGNEVGNRWYEAALLGPDAGNAFVGQPNPLFNTLRGVMESRHQGRLVRLVVSGKVAGALGQGLGPASQLEDADVMEVGELADHVSPPTLGEGASHTRVADTLDKAEVDTVINPPGF